MEIDPPDKPDETGRRTDEVSKTTSGNNNTDNAISDDNERASSANAMANDCGVLLTPNTPPSNCNELISEDKKLVIKLAITLAIIAAQTEEEVVLKCWRTIL